LTNSVLKVVKVVEIFLAFISENKYKTFFPGLQKAMDPVEV